MKNRFFISDTHFNHRGIIGFRDAFNQICRPNPKTGKPFSSPEEHDEFIVEEWNQVVKPGDRVYHLGDVAMGKKGVETIGRLNGQKILVPGNHDHFAMKEYLKVFKEVRPPLMFPPGKRANPSEKYGFVAQHFPVHWNQFHKDGIWTHNIHGHTHHNLITTRPRDETGYAGGIDRRYINVTCEYTQCRPISFEEIIEGIENGTLWQR